MRRNKIAKPYFFEKNIWADPKADKTDETIKLLEEIAPLVPGKNAQIAAEKISEKYKKIREANARINKYKIPGEIVRIEKVETNQGEVNAPVSIEKPKGSGKKATKKIIKKYDKIWQEKTFKKIVDANEKRKKNKNIEIIEDIKDSAAKKSTRITAKKILNKYKSMKRPKKAYLVNEQDIEMINYDEPEKDLFKSESIVNADFEKFKKRLKRKASKEEKDIFHSRKKRLVRKDKTAQIAAEKISKKYKNIRFR